MTERDETKEDKQKRWEREHRELVDSGEFDNLPKPSITPGDVVAVRNNNLIHQVYDVIGNSVIVGYDKSDGEEVREIVSIDDIKGAKDYQNLLLRKRGLGKQLGVTVEERTAKLWDKTKLN